MNRRTILTTFAAVGAALGFGWSRRPPEARASGTCGGSALGDLTCVDVRKPEGNPIHNRSIVSGPSGAKFELWVIKDGNEVEGTRREITFTSAHTDYTVFSFNSTEDPCNASTDRTYRGRLRAWDSVAGDWTAHVASSAQDFPFNCSVI